MIKSGKAKQPSPTHVSHTHTHSCHTQSLHYQQLWLEASGRQVARPSIQKNAASCGYVCIKLHTNAKRIKWGSDDALYPEGQRSNFTVKSLCATKTLFWPLSCTRSRRGDCDCISRLVGGWMRDTNVVRSPGNCADCIDLLSDCRIFCSLFTATLTFEVLQSSTNSLLEHFWPLLKSSKVLTTYIVWMWTHMSVKCNVTGGKQLKLQFLGKQWDKQPAKVYSHIRKVIFTGARII